MSQSIVEAAAQPAQFTCMHSPDVFGKYGRTRWIAHDPDKHYAGEFGCEQDARDAVARWNSNSGAEVKITWRAPDKGAPESDRGMYTVLLSGTRWHRMVGCDWFADGAAAGLASQLRNLIAKHGLDVVREILDVAR